MEARDCRWRLGTSRHPGRRSRRVCRSARFDALCGRKRHRRGSIKLPAPPNTDIVSDEQGSLFFCIGTLRCEVLCNDTQGRIRWRKTVAQDDGLTYPLSLDPTGGLWVPTDEGLLLLDRSTGEVIAQFGCNKWRCVSQALPSESGTAVVVAYPSGRCSVVRVFRSGTPLTRFPFQSCAEPACSRVYGATDVVGRLDSLWLGSA